MMGDPVRHPLRTAPRLLAALAVVASLAGGPVVHAQEASPAATPSAFCAILTPAEVTAVIGLDVTIGQSLDDFCSYDAGNGLTSLTVQHDKGAGKVADLKTYFSDATDTTVAGRPGLLVLGGSALYVDVPDGTLTLQLLGYAGSGTDATAALVTLAPTAMDRLTSLEGGPATTPKAGPSFAGDADLAALFPTTIGGQPIKVQTYTARELADQGVDPATIQAITDGLAAVGKTLDDMTLGFSSYSGGDLSAIRVRGVDAVRHRATADASRPRRRGRPTADDHAGRRQGRHQGHQRSRWRGRQRHYFYAHDDVLWIVTASDPDLTEILQALP